MALAAVTSRIPTGGALSVRIAASIWGMGSRAATALNASSRQSGGVSSRKTRVPRPTAVAAMTPEA
jgi:hypothetical protein